MTTKTTFFKKALAMLVAVTVFIAAMPAVMLPAAASSGIVYGDKRADLSTMDSWQTLFPEGNTTQAGRIWTDKSVFTDADVFDNLKDVNGNDVSIEMTDEDNNFLVALSALASNKSIVGYSYMPTDTMLVLDASASMGNSNYVDDLVTAANSAIEKLLGLNYHNRVGVVMYSGSTTQGNSAGNTATVLLPLDRYTHSGNRFLTNNGQSSISINSNVKDGDGRTVTQRTKNVSGGTYIQNGVYMAMEEFLAVTDTVIPDGENQAGTTRAPIFVLMSDGEPTTATTNFAGLSNGNNTDGLGTSKLGDGTSIEDDVLYDVVDFVNQLTAAYAVARVDEHYAASTPLYYTLGVGNNNTLNSAVLDPESYTNTDELWEEYIGTRNGSNLIVEVEEGRNPDTESLLKIEQISDVAQKNYVTEYFAATNATGLINAFQQIVNQIIIQSLYYPTHVDNGDHDNDGYVEFIDDIGHYMDVKDIKGITIGDTLFTGERLAANFTPTGGELLNPDGSYSALGDNMVWSVQQRLGIANVQDARDLINLAYEAGQLRYYVATGEWSNYIGWYADDAGNFLGHWHDGHTAADAPAGATYINRSYGMLGDVKGELTETNMMYISTQVHTRIEDGHVALIWRIPASLVPVATYDITLDGETLLDAETATIDYKAADPIRIIFEVGITEDINLVNVTDKITDPAEHILDENEDGVSDDGKYYFYTNWWSDGNLSHENPSHTEDTIVFFEPSLQNERYYYAEETAVYVKTGSGETDADYELYDGAKPDADDDNTYYRRYVVFEASGAANANGIPAKVVPYYEVMSDDTIGVLTDANRNPNGTWDVPAGTIHRVLEPYNLEKADKDLTQTLDYVRYPVIEDIPEKDGFYVGSLLGNNGRLAIDIPQGVKITKTVDNTLYGTDDTYTFDVTAAVADGDYEAYREAADGTLTAAVVTFSAGAAQITLSADESLYIFGIDDGTDVTVSEQINGDYKVAAITVDGVAQTGSAQTAVPLHDITEIVFTNTLVVNDGTIIVSKEVVIDDPALNENADQLYSFKWYNKATPEDFETFSIKASQTKALTGLTPGETYVVEEIAIPDGYTPRNNPIEITMPDTAAAVEAVHFVNEYAADAVKPNLTVSGTKTLVGRDWKEGDSFTFKLQVLQGAGWVDLAERTVEYNAAGEYDVYTFDFANDAELQDLAIEVAGVHYFRVSEVIPAEKLGGVTYDEAYRYFSITVTDATMDGKLEIASVNATAPVTVASNNNGWAVDVDFTNTYTASGTDDLVITIDKTVTDNVGANTGKDGFTFGLYTVGGTSPIVTSEPTDENGHTTLTLSFSAAYVGRVYNFEIREIVPENKLAGMDYDPAVYPVTIKIVDNLDGTVSAVIETPEADVEGIEVGFTNIYDPADAEVTFVGTKVMDGRDFDVNEFTFELYKDGETVPKLATNDSKANGGKFTFETLKFGTIGTSHYTIKEKVGTLGGVTYSGKEYDVAIDVTDDTDNDGTLNVQVKIDGVVVDPADFAATLVFTNVYETEDVEVPLDVLKMLEGRDLVDGEFKFDLYAANENFVKGDVLQDDIKLVLQPDGTGKVPFTALTFDDIGDYHYVIVEDEVDGKGVTVDTTEFKVHIKVTHNLAGKLEAAVTVNGAADGEIVFNNVYSAEEVEVGLTGVKTLEGRDLVDGEFKFDLYEADESFVKGDVLQDDVKLVLQPDGTGNITFADMTFGAVGDYYFVIVEDEVDGKGVTVDTTEFKVHIKVTDNLEGKLEAAVFVNDIADGEIVFNNRYEAADAEIVISGTKVIEGKSLEDKEFTFKLYEATVGADGKYTVGEELDTTQNAANGEFRFEAITIEEEGTYYYVIREDATEQKEGIAYDTAEYLAKVVVTDALDGTMDVKVTYTVDDKAADTLRFNNIFTEVFKKKVFLTTNPEVNIDGKSVAYGEILTYVIEYTNAYDTAHADVTIVDTIPVGTVLVEGTATEGAVYDAEAGTLTWKKTVPAKTTWAVKFDVKVVEGGEEITNAARAFYGENEYVTNEVVTTSGEKPEPTPEPEPPVESPETGDSGNLALWIALLFVSGGVFFGTMKKKEQEEA